MTSKGRSIKPYLNVHNIIVTDRQLLAVVHNRKEKQTKTTERTAGK
jgi:hypothetical protein